MMALKIEVKSVIKARSNQTPPGPRFNFDNFNPSFLKLIETVNQLGISQRKNYRSFVTVIRLFRPTLSFTNNKKPGMIGLKILNSNLHLLKPVYVRSKLRSYGCKSIFFRFLQLLCRTCSVWSRHSRIPFRVQKLFALSQRLGVRHDFFYFIFLPWKGHETVLNPQNSLAMDFEIILAH